jgi:predicted nucleic acid-binding Zn ribbon protein
VISGQDTPTERPCRGCGAPLEPDQLACLECGDVTVPERGRDRRWLFSTGGVAGIALFLVTSASFAASTALRTGDPHATKPAAATQPIAQVPAPQTPAADEAAAQAAREQEIQRKREKAAQEKAAAAAAAKPATPAPAAPAPAAPAPAAPAPAAPATPPAGNGSSGGDTTDTPPPTNVALTTWDDNEQGAYTVVVYKFPDKSGAKLKAQEVAGKDLPAGILHSDSYESLEPGSWVVFIGEFDTAAKAEAAQAKYDRAGYPGEVTFVGHQESPDVEQYQEAGATP